MEKASNPCFAHKSLWIAGGGRIWAAECFEPLVIARDVSLILSWAFFPAGFMVLDTAAAAAVSASSYSYVKFQFAMRLTILVSGRFYIKIVLLLHDNFN
ncbi:hypothetical protein Ancab_027004 [Ancistrocladus abbreviatus]